MRQVLIVVLMLGSFLLLSLPVGIYIGQELKRRRDEFLNGLGQTAKELYLSLYHRINNLPAQELDEYFVNLYDRLFGRWRFVPPSALLALIALTGLTWTGVSTINWLGLSDVSDKMADRDKLAVLGFLGAYMYVLYDHIDRVWNRSLTPSTLYWSSFRLLIAIPMAYAMKAFFNESIAPSIAFLLGAFPTNALLTIARRITSKQINVTNMPDTFVNELQALQGIDGKQAEQFASEGITTMLQLAYADPIRLMIRTNFTYSYLVDCMSQSMLGLYVGEDIKVLRKLGLRGSYEVYDLYMDFMEGSVEDQKKAEENIAKISAKMKYTETIFCRVMKEIAFDPYTDFLWHSWAGNNG